jgi:hypothetical protein
MKQYEAVITTLERLGGQATLAQLYQEVMKVDGVAWGTKTPFASIRRIVQVRPEIFKVRPGLWALESHRSKLGLSREDSDVALSEETLERSHSYYQGLLAMIGNLRGFSTFIPNQDKNKLCLRKPLAEVRTLQQVPAFSYEEITRRAATVDVSWFNDRRMPDSLFEVEHSTDIHNSLLKFLDLQDFNSRMVVVASAPRRREFDQKAGHRAFREIAERVAFYDYEALARDYEHEALRSSRDFSL